MLKNEDESFIVVNANECAENDEYDNHKVLAQTTMNSILLNNFKVF